jgi:phosphoribosylglycinamide formyltransferase-1
MIDRIEAGKLDAEIILAVSNNADAYGLVRARKHGIPTAVVDYGKYGKRMLPKVDERDLPEGLSELIRRQRIFAGLPYEQVQDRLARLVLAEQEIIGLMAPAEPDLICLAGYMRLISPHLIAHCNKSGTYRIMNIHPALLPAFPGTRGYEDTFAYGCRYGGITVHYVDEGEDTGPIIAQAIYPIWPDDTLDDVRKRGLELEYGLYSQCIQWLAQGDLQVEQGEKGRPHVRILDPEYPGFLEQLTRQAFAR